MAGGIYLLQGSELVEMAETAYASEDLLQDLLARYPNLLAGDQLNPSEPRRWLLIAREMGVPEREDGSARWAIDHLFLDQEAVPTLVEVKRSSDTRLRREVVGQMLDYAANAAVYWTPERIQAAFEANCEAESIDPEETLIECLGLDYAIEEFWQQVKVNLRAGRLRLIFVADVVPPELVRIVEFLNEQMDPAEVLAVEVRQYVGGEGLKTLVPRVVGRTATAQQRKQADTGAKRSWDEQSFMAELQSKRGAGSVSIAQGLLRWAEGQGLPVWWGQGASYGSFSPRVIKNGQRHQLFVVWTNGVINLYFDALSNKEPFADAELRRELLRRLNAEASLGLDENAINKQPAVELQHLTTLEVREGFQQVFEWAVNRIQND